MTEVPIWHVPHWDHLIERRKGDRLPHALLLHGQAGLGKRQFAELLAKSLLCTHPDEAGKACGNCHACQMFSAGTHPDLRWLEPEEKGKVIRVDAIRDLCAHLALKSQFGAKKVAILVPAEGMNIASYNALLKTLEEPSPETLLILISSRPAYLPATIRSRCQSLAFTVPERQIALQWLEERAISEREVLLSIANGAPFLAERLAQSDCIEQRRQLLVSIDDIRFKRSDPVAIAANYLKQEVNSLCLWMLSYVTDMIRLKMVGIPPRLSNQDLQEGLSRLAESLSCDELFTLQDALLAVQRQLDTSVNTQLLLEELFLRWIPTHPRRVAER